MPDAAMYHVTPTIQHTHTHIPHSSQVGLAHESSPSLFTRPAVIFHVESLRGQAPGAGSDLSGGLQFERHTWNLRKNLHSTGPWSEVVDKLFLQQILYVLLYTKTLEFMKKVYTSPAGLCQVVEQ